MADVAARSVFVHNIGDDVTEDEIKALFGHIGKIDRFAKQYDAERKISGYGVLYMKHTDAASSVQFLNGIELKSARLVVESSVYSFPNMYEGDSDEENEGDSHRQKGEKKKGEKQRKKAEVAEPEAHDALPHNHKLPGYDIDPWLIPALLSIHEEEVAARKAPNGGEGDDAPPSIEPDTLEAPTLYEQFKDMQERLAALDLEVQQTKKKIAEANVVKLARMEAQRKEDDQKAQQFAASGHPLRNHRARIRRTLICADVPSDTIPVSSLVELVSRHFGAISTFASVPHSSDPKLYGQVLIEFVHDEDMKTAVQELCPEYLSSTVPADEATTAGNGGEDAKPEPKKPKLTKLQEKAAKKKEQERKESYGVMLRAAGEGGLDGNWSTGPANRMSSPIATAVEGICHLPSAVRHQHHAAIAQLLGPQYRQ